jgi:hypothetical protein
VREDREFNIGIFIGILGHALQHSAAARGKALPAQALSP